ncbi:MAG: DAK2 domain-containing protein [Bacilli bacterium]|nr:DAK2 domain-containing protein [Bacilli bacterium]
MKIINGQILKQMFISGSNNLYNFYPEVDALNVFPVPDGDTGMNMNLTLTSGSKEIQNRNDNNVYEIAKAFSRGLLMGARGNSGVITSQIFRGFAQGLEGKEEINAVGFSDALQKGVEVAYKAVIRPVEGTILTVVRESSQYLHDHVKDSMSIEKAMEMLIQEARESLKRTPELLPVLKEVGVVDSGGAGLIHIYEGMEAAIKGEVIERSQATSVDKDNPIVAAGASMEEEEFGYCTVFLLQLGPDSVKKPFNEKRFTNILMSHGNSLVVVRDEDLVKVHVHTLNPGNILNYAQQFGEFLKISIANMTEQHHDIKEGGSGNEVYEEDDMVAEMRSMGDKVNQKEEAKPREKFALIGVSSGEGIDEFFNDIGFTEIVKGGQTMNPSSEDFLTAIKKANADNIYIFPNNSNIVMAANQASEMAEDENTRVFVVPSKTIPQGITSSIMFNPDASPEENFTEMKSALKTVTSGEITFAIRDTEINGLKMKKDDFIGIMEKEIVVAGKEKEEVLFSLLEKMVNDESSLITLICGEDISEEQANEISGKISEKYSDLDVDLHMGKQPVYSFLIGVE